MLENAHIPLNASSSANIDIQFGLEKDHKEKTRGIFSKDKHNTRSKKSPQWSLGSIEGDIILLRDLITSRISILYQHLVNMYPMCLCTQNNYIVTRR